MAEESVTDYDLLRRLTIMAGGKNWRDAWVQFNLKLAAIGLLLLLGGLLMFFFGICVLAFAGG